MAMQQVNEDGKLKEISRAQGGDWGGIYVDEEFKHMLEKIVSKPIVEAFRMAHTMDYIDLFRNFERKKRQKQTSSNVTISVPGSLPEIVDDINRHIEEQGLKELVTYKKGRFLIKLKKYEEFFNNVIDKIVVKVEEMLVSDTAEGTNVIIMVGGFSASNFLQQRIKDYFPSYTVVTPPECGLAVLKGAVLYGHDPDIIAARKLEAEAYYSSMSKRGAENNVTSCRNFLSGRKLQGFHPTLIAANGTDSFSNSSDWEPVVQGNFL